MEIKKKRWLILIASCFVSLCIGSMYAWSVFASPLASYLTEISGKEITNLAIVFTVANSVGPITMICGGRINDKLGPRMVLLAGGLLFGAGMIGSGFATSVMELVISYGLGVGLGVGMVYGITVNNTVKYFPDKGGFAGGLITATYGSSSIIIPPVANAMLQKFSVNTTLKVIGVVMTIIICFSAFIIEKCPENICGQPEQKKSEEARLTSAKEFSYREMLKEKKFYIMLLTLTCGAFAGMMVISQASDIAQNMMDFSVGSAAMVVSILALFNTLGRLVSGTISDRIGALDTLRIVFFLSFIANVILYFCSENTVAVFYIGLCVVGFCFGGIMGIYPGFTAGQFGRRNNSVNFGIMFIGFALAGLFGPMMMSSIKAAVGIYQPAFLAAAIFAVGGEILLFVFSKENSR